VPGRAGTDGQLDSRVGRAGASQAGTTTVPLAVTKHLLPGRAITSRLGRDRRRNSSEHCGRLATMSPDSRPAASSVAQLPSLWGCPFNGARSPPVSGESPGTWIIAGAPPAGARSCQRPGTACCLGGTVIIHGLCEHGHYHDLAQRAYLRAQRPILPKVARTSVG